KRHLRAKARVPAQLLRGVANALLGRAHLHLPGERPVALKLHGVAERAEVLDALDVPADEAVLAREVDPLPPDRHRRPTDSMSLSLASSSSAGPWPPAGGQGGCTSGKGGVLGAGLPLSSIRSPRRA